MGMVTDMVMTTAMDMDMQKFILLIKKHQNLKNRQRVQHIEKVSLNCDMNVNFVDNFKLDLFIIF